MKCDLPLASLDLPNDWSDNTAYQFSSPTPKGLEVPLATGKGAQVTVARSAVVLARLVVPDGQSLEQVVRKQEELLRAVPGLKILSRDPVTHPTYGLCASVLVTFEASPGCIVEQRHVYFERPRPEPCVQLTLSCDARAAAEPRATLEQILASVAFT